MRPDHVNLQVPGGRRVDLTGAVHAWKERSQTFQNPHRLRKRPERKDRKSVAKKILAAMLAMGRSR